MGEINSSSGASNGSPSELSIISDTGTGKATLILSVLGASSRGDFPTLLDTITASLVGRIVVAGIPESFIQERWRELPLAVDALLASLGLRHIHVVATDEVTPTAQFLAIARPGLVASLVLGNPQFRARSTAIERFAHFIEQMLPLGLPLRTGKDKFFSAAYLQRIRCPVLVLWDVPPSERGGQRSAMVSQLPLGWEVVLEGDYDGASVRSLVDTFREVRVRCPMRRKGGVAAMSSPS